MSELFSQAEVRKALSTMIEPRAVFEIRVLHGQLKGIRRQGTISGYFNDPDICLSELERLYRAGGVYFTINPVNPALLSRCKNRLTYAENNSTTSDRHIEQRKSLLLDVDPDRPSGISSSQAEKAAAKKKAHEIYDYLKGRGWPDPVVADSGNGFHLVYGVDLPSADGGLSERVIAALADRFDGDGVKLDRTVHNPARIARLYGTLAAKGDDTDERPHRFSKILSQPERLEAVTAEQLRTLVDESQPKESAHAEPASSRKASFDMEEFLVRFRVEFTEKILEPDGTIKWRLKQCPFHPDHESPDAAVFLRPDGIRGFHCFHNSCADKHWQDFRRHLEPEAQADTKEGDFTPLGSFGATEYPAPLEDAAYYGLAGDIVRRIEPHTEADPVALLVQTLVAFGNVIGRNARAIADGSRHYTNLNTVLVGETAKGRKGTAWQHVRRLFAAADEGWAERIVNGLSSGEGLIWAVRDPIKEKKPVKKNGRVIDYETVVVDHGVEDKRLLVVEAEFAKVLKVMSREGNTLSPVIRSAWDDGNLRILTKNSPAHATDAHISMIGHITRGEVRRNLTETESANGFANRFPFVAVKRSKCLPEGGDSYGIADLMQRLQKAIEFGRSAGELQRSDEARKLWASLYPKLSEGKPGLLGAITARAEAQVLRFSNLYALLDCSVTVEVVHLRAALALWAYCDRSAVWVFESGTGSKNADRILAALKVAGEKGLTRLQITNEVFNRHATKFEIDEALRLLHGLKLAVRKLEGTATRPAERWFYKAPGGEVCEESTPEDGKTGDTSHYSHPPPSQNASSADSPESDTQAETLVGDESGVARL